jgi:hypothetical protein
MWDNYKPTKSERAAVENAWQVVYRLTGHDWRTEDMTRQEAKGYGNRHDRIGLNGAKALAVKWFYNGTQQPDLKLTDYYFCRPAAIWFTGYGASKAYAISVEDENTLEAGLTAHEAAFKRMIDENRIAA